MSDEPVSVSTWIEIDPDDEASIKWHRQWKEFQEVVNHYMAFEPRNEEEERIMDILFRSYCQSMPTRPKNMRKLMEKLLLAVLVEQKTNNDEKQIPAIAEVRKELGIDENTSLKKAKSVERMIENLKQKPK